MTGGVTVAICTHNGAARLQTTLSFLAAQAVPDEVPWEVLVVDNASGDRSAEVARRCWPVAAPAPLRVVSEPSLGLSQARDRAFRSAHYDVVSFVDDDNWVCANWVATVSEIMRSHPEVGACGGLATPTYEMPPPPWFERYLSCFAVGPQGNGDGGACYTYGLHGAGLSVRKTSWLQLRTAGFRQVLPDREGARLSGGGDVELCLALRLAGWKLWYDPRLTLSHYIPAHRTEWEYVRRLHRGIAASNVSLNPYVLALQPTHRCLADRVRQSWYYQVASSLKQICKHAHLLAQQQRSTLVGEARVVSLESQLGRLTGLWNTRSTYQRMIGEVANAAWRSCADSGAAGS